MQEPDRRAAGRPGGSRSGRPEPLSLDERLSRFLAYVLRHHPEEAGLALDERGSADLNQVLDAVRARPGLAGVTRERLLALLAGPAAQRFEVTGDRVRARYGHSLAQTIRYDAADPPADLFHGTDRVSAERILAEGLKPGARQYVHLSVDTPAAREVGRRHSDDPAVLRIDTGRARQAGVSFYRAGAAVWLADAIPPECIAQVE
jgi:putative RNA 2'-phosphotransferase